MKTEIVINNAKVLATQLSIVSKVVNKNPILPILDCFHMAISNNSLTVTASNLEITVSTIIDVQCDKDLIFCVPHKLFTETIKGLGDMPFTIIIDMDSLSLSIVSMTGNYKMSCEGSNDFPLIDSTDDAKILTLESSVLKRGIEKVSYAVSSDFLRLALMGVYFNFTKESFIMAATDAHMLSEHKILPIEKKGFDVKGKISAIVPIYGLNMVSLLPDGENIDIYMSPKNIIFKTGTSTIICRSIDAKFPEYTPVIPNVFNMKVTVDRKEFLSSIKRVSIFANKTTNQIILNIGEDKIKFEVNDFVFSNSAKESIGCQISKEDYEEDINELTIGLNASIVKDVISAGDTHDVELLFISNSKPLVIIDESVDFERTISLCMPILLIN